MKQGSSTFKEIIKLYSFNFLAKLRTYQRWYFGTPNEYVEQFVPRQGNIIDLGCGWGVFSNLLAIKSPERNILGIDLDKTKIEWAQRTVTAGRENISFALQDIKYYDLPEVDAIVIYDVMHHLEESVQFDILKECYRKLLLSGRLILKENDVVPKWKLLMSYFVEIIASRLNITLSKKITFRNRKDWVNILEKHGFTVIHEEQIKTFYGFFVPHSLFICEKRLVF